MHFAKKKIQFLQKAFECKQMICKAWFASCLCVGSKLWAKMNQQPPMHQLVILSTGWTMFFHSVPSGVHDNPFLFVVDHCT
jgi:hypothetical protein